MNINITQNLWAAKEWARVNATGDHYVTMVHEATNEEKWGPTGEQMENICRNYPRGGTVIMEELQWKLKSRDKAWRPCYKALLVIDYLARNVKDTYLAEICSLVPTLRNIAQSFYYTNPKGVDHGVSVRERAKNLADLLSDGLLLREEREKAAATKAKLAKGASDGGGPAAYRGGDRYGGYAGGGSRSAGAYGGDRYGGYGGGYGARSGGGGGGGGYDPYPAPRRREPSPPVPRSKEEQERYDMELALRMQREEERRAGVSAEQLENMYAKKVQKRQERAEELKRYAGDADEELARRLQQEEEERARREGRSLPTLRSENQPTSPPPVEAAKPATPPAPAPAQPEPPKHDVLDDLFAPAPQPPQPQTSNQGGDPFGAYAGVAPAQQANPWDAQAQGQSGQQYAQNPWGQPSAQPQQGGWGGQPQPQPTQPQPSTSAWGQPQQPNAWSQPTAAQSAMPSSDPWGQPQQQPSGGDPWGQPQQPPSQGQWGQPQPPQPQQQQVYQQPQPSGDPWNQPQQQQQQQQQQSGGDPWGGFSNPNGTTPSANTANKQASNAADDPMWAAFGQFTQQQQRQR